MRFSNSHLKSMIIPLFWEQLLVLLVGIIDTLVISQYIGRLRSGKWKKFRVL